MEKIDNEKLIAKRIFELTIAVTLLLIVISTLLFSIAMARESRGIDWGFAFIIAAMFLPANAYAVFVAVLMFKGKSGKSMIVHLLIILVLALAWGVGSFMVLILMLFWRIVLIGAISGIMGLTLSIIAITTILIYLIKFIKKRE